MSKSKPEKHNDARVPEGETRSYASSPCSLHELDAEFWPLSPADESDDKLTEKSNQGTQTPDSTPSTS